VPVTVPKYCLVPGSVSTSASSDGQQALLNCCRPRRNESRQRIESGSSPCRRASPKPAIRRLESAVNLDFCRCMAERQFKTGCSRSRYARLGLRAPTPDVDSHLGRLSAVLRNLPFGSARRMDKPTTWRPCPANHCCGWRRIGISPPDLTIADGPHPSPGTAAPGQARQAAAAIRPVLGRA
jgi:hypothetical protein